MKKKYLILLFCVVIALFIAFLPRPIIHNDNNVIWCRVQYNPDFDASGEELIEITDFDTDKITECLTRYKQMMTLSRSRGYGLANAEIIVSVHTNEGFEEIVLGNINYNFQGHGRFKRKILNADKLKNELLQIIGK